MRSPQRLQRLREARWSSSLRRRVVLKGNCCCLVCGAMPALKGKDRPICYSVKGQVKILRLVRAGQRGWGQCETMLMGREMAIK